MAVEGSEFDGRVALVTGAGRGIGACVARALAVRGASVAAVDALGDGLDALQDEVAQVTGYIADVTDSADVNAVVERAESEQGPLDILVNVAGILRTAPVVELDDEDWAATFAVNASGVFHTCRAVARRMRQRRRGCIVTVGSNAAGVPRTHMAAYAASKAAATMFTKCLGLELARDGIRCNVVSPGSTNTAMQRDWGGPDGARRAIDGELAAYRVGIPLGRIAEPSDIVDAVLFLVSDRARHITMHDLYVDGGATLRA
jgi:2,3-dihydro-2,3-dihydroxybenzoate dehydrogenase